jgi:S-DNA-T family DNA segregation ATPase FtsK/SpoIIIE
MLPQVARTYPGRPAGRVLTGDGTWAQIALPRSDGAEATVGLNVALAEVVARVARRGGPATQPIQLLPALVPARSLPRPSRDGSVVLGLSGPYARPVELGLQPGEHLLVLGNPGSGRSGLLRSIALSLQDGGRPTWFVDPRRSLVPVAGPACGHATSAEETVALFERLAASREGWTAAGAGDVLFVDDLDLVGRSTAAGSLVQLLEVLPFAADHGLSLVVSRRLSGYARAAYEPFFAGFLELCDSAVVLSGDPAEGPVIGGVRPRRLAPGRGQLVVRGEARGEIQTAWLSGDAGHHADPTADRQFAQPGASARIGM